MVVRDSCRRSVTAIVPPEAISGNLLIFPCGVASIFAFPSCLRMDLAEVGPIKRPWLFDDLALACYQLP